MKVNLQNIVNNAIFRGLNEGYDIICDDEFKGNGEDAVQILYESVTEQLEHYIDFSDEDTPKPKQIGFSTLAKSEIALPTEENETGVETEQRVNLPKKLDKK